MDKKSTETGHCLVMSKAGKFNDKFKPRCKCGWVGYAGNKSQARTQYRDHAAGEKK
jgi:hypothetical protein